MPAPPPESEPAMERQTGTGRDGVVAGAGLGHGPQASRAGPRAASSPPSCGPSARAAEPKTKNSPRGRQLRPPAERRQLRGQVVRAPRTA